MGVWQSEVPEAQVLSIYRVENPTLVRAPSRCREEEVDPNLGVKPCIHEYVSIYIYTYTCVYIYKYIFIYHGCTEHMH